MRNKAINKWHSRHKTIFAQASFNCVCLRMLHLKCNGYDRCVFLDVNQESAPCVQCRWTDEVFDVMGNKKDKLVSNTHTQRSCHILITSQLFTRSLRICFDNAKQRERFNSSVRQEAKKENWLNVLKNKSMKKYHYAKRVVIRLANKGNCGANTESVGSCDWRF